VDCGVKIPARCLILAGLALCLHMSAIAQQDIHNVDFKNFTFPLSGPLLGHDRLEWLGLAGEKTVKKSPIHLVNGASMTAESSFTMAGKEYVDYAGFKLESVRFADLTDDGQEEAIVVLRYYTGGTQTTNYVYIYALDGNKPKLLAYCHTGSRAYSGLYAVYGSNGSLVFELLDPQKRLGDCCSSGVIVSRYKWQSDRFEIAGTTKRRNIPPPEAH
jgi:hypothetical protein